MLTDGPDSFYQGVLHQPLVMSVSAAERACCDLHANRLPDLSDSELPCQRKRRRGSRRRVLRCDSSMQACGSEDLPRADVLVIDMHTY